MGRPSYRAELRDILLTLLLLDHSSLGRYRLSQYLNLTKAKTRSVLEFLNENKIIESKVGRGGSHLTSEGREIVSQIKQYCMLDWNQEFVEVETDLIGKEGEIAIMFINGTGQNTSGLYERDMAVRQGAEGAITLQSHNGSWIFPNDEKPAEHLKLLNKNTTENYQLLAITFGETLGSVYAAAAAIVIYHLEDELEEIIQL